MIAFACGPKKVGGMSFACQSDLVANLHAQCARKKGRHLSYACVLAVGEHKSDIDASISSIQQQYKMTPFVTAWCSRCFKNEILTSYADAFPDPSSFLAHVHVYVQNQHPSPPPES